MSSEDRYVLYGRTTAPQEGDFPAAHTYLCSSSSLAGLARARELLGMTDRHLWQIKDRSTERIIAESAGRQEMQQLGERQHGGSAWLYRRLLDCHRQFQPRQFSFTSNCGTSWQVSIAMFDPRSIKGQARFTKGERDCTEAEGNPAVRDAISFTLKSPHEEATLYLRDFTTKTGSIRWQDFANRHRLACLAWREHCARTAGQGVRHKTELLAELLHEHRALAEELVALAKTEPVRAGTIEPDGIAVTRLLERIAISLCTAARTEAGPLPRLIYDLLFGDRQAAAALLAQASPHLPGCPAEAAGSSFSPDELAAWLKKAWSWEHGSADLTRQFAPVSADCGCPCSLLRKAAQAVLEGWQPRYVAQGQSQQPRPTYRLGELRFGTANKLPTFIKTGLGGDSLAEVFALAAECDCARPALLSGGSGNSLLVVSPAGRDQLLAAPRGSQQWLAGAQDQRLENSYEAGETGAGVELRAAGTGLGWSKSGYPAITLLVTLAANGTSVSRYTTHDDLSIGASLELAKAVGLTDAQAEWAASRLRSLAWDADQQCQRHLVGVTAQTLAIADPQFVQAGCHLAEAVAQIARQLTPDAPLGFGQPPIHTHAAWCTGSLTRLIARREVAAGRLTEEEYQVLDEHAVASNLDCDCKRLGFWLARAQPESEPALATTEEAHAG